MLTDRLPRDFLLEARDFLISHYHDYPSAHANFTWPRLDAFNFALDWFDQVAPEKEALRIVGPSGSMSRTFGQLSTASNRAANLFRSIGLRRGDTVLLMLGNVEPLWVVLLAAIKLGLVTIPTSTLIGREDLRDRLTRGGVRMVVAAAEFEAILTDAGYAGPVVGVGAHVEGWRQLDDYCSCSEVFCPQGETRSSDPLLLYFTSGTTAKPKLVVHSHASYPIGHLSTLYWMGLKPGDIHLNISSPGWAKHAWSSFFAPWLAEATVLVLDQPRFSPVATLDTLVREKVTTFCAPPTVWRMLIQEDLGSWPVALREAISAGEPLNSEIIDHVRAAWSVTIRDGFGQTETTAQIGNPPGLPALPGSMGRVLPGYRIVLLDPEGEQAAEGEIAIVLGDERPVALMAGYLNDGVLNRIEGDVYRTGDVARRDDDGVFTYVGRADDVFKASDYRISPFELESALLEHPAVMEAAVVASPHATRLAVPKAFVTLTPGAQANAATARAILDHAATALGPFKRVRRIEFSDLPKTISGKIRRVELRELERSQRAAGERGPTEWFEEDFRPGDQLGERRVGDLA